jgi:hypothetical protein
MGGPRPGGAKPGPGSWGGPGSSGSEAKYFFLRFFSSSAVHLSLFFFLSLRFDSAGSGSGLGDEGGLGVEGGLGDDGDLGGFFEPGRSLGGSSARFESRSGRFDLERARWPFRSVSCCRQGSGHENLAMMRTKDPSDRLPSQMDVMMNVLRQTIMVKSSGMTMKKHSISRPMANAWMGQ